MKLTLRKVSKYYVLDSDLHHEDEWLDDEEAKDLADHLLNVANNLLESRYKSSVFNSLVDAGFDIVTEQQDKIGELLSTLEWCVEEMSLLRCNLATFTGSSKALYGEAEKRAREMIEEHSNKGVNK